MIPYKRPIHRPTLYSRAPSGITFSKRFDNDKIKKIRPELAQLAVVFEKVSGTKPKLPRCVYSMSLADIRNGKRARRDAGHGMHDPATDTIKVDPAMGPDNILLNIVHEMIHADLPWLGEKEVDQLSDRIIKKLRRTVGKRRDTPNPTGLDVNCLTEGLWIGAKPEIGRTVAESGFDLLVLCAEEYQPPAWQFPGVEVIHAPFDDSDIGPYPHEKKIARQAAKRVVDALRQDSNVLVTCYAGRNRSGLVCGLALVENGVDPIRAIRLIQDRREKALSNQWFVDLIAGS